MKKSAAIYLCMLLLIFSNRKLNSQVSGAAYTCLGPFNLENQNMGFISAVWSDTLHPGLIYAGSLYGGLWKGIKKNNNDDQSWQWSNITDNWKYPGTGITAIEVVPNTNAQEIYIGTQLAGNARLFSYGNGILKTMDGGVTWQQVGPEIKIAERKVVEFLRMCPEDPNRMFARINTEYYYTTDRWKTFSRIAPPLLNKSENMHVADVKWKPSDSKTFYFTTRCDDGVKGEFFMSNDDGKTWKDMREGITAGNIQIDVVNKKGMENFIYMAYANNGAYIRIFDGLKWSANRNRLAVFSGSGYWNMEFEVNDVDTSVMYFSMTTIMKSLNGGKTFSPITEYWGTKTHADVRDLKILKSSAGGKQDVIIMANDGGVSYSLPGVANSSAWVNANGNGLAVSQFWGISTSEQADVVIGGGQDNGIYSYADGVWKNQTSGIGDGYEACVSDLNPDYGIAQGNSPSLFITENKGNKWTAIQGAPGPSHLFRRPMQIDKATHKLWLGHHHLYMKDNSTGKLDGQWKQKSFIPDIKSEKLGWMNHVINCFAIGRKNENTALLAYNATIWQKDSLKGKLYYTSNLNDEKPVWKDLTRFHSFFDWREVMDLEADPNNENTFYLFWVGAYAGFENEVKRIKIIGNGDSMIVDDITYNLPLIPKSKVVMEKGETGNMYVATDSGIYFTNYKMLAEKKWERFHNYEKPLPFCVISDLEINYTTNRLYIATYGRGVWYTPLAETGNAEEVTVRKNTVWDTTKKIDGKLIVAKGKTLTITAPLFITSKSEIILKKRAKLIILSPEKEKESFLKNNNGENFDVSKIVRGKMSKVKTGITK
jgi:hypothetical protein